MKKHKPQQIKDLINKICECIDHAMFAQSRHAIQRQNTRDISLEDALYVLKTGYHEKDKTYFDDAFQEWKYAIRGKTLENLDIRVIIAFDKYGMIIITVMHVIKNAG